MKANTKMLLVEPFLVSKVVFCWMVGLPVFALCRSGLTVWDKASSAVGALGRSRYGSRFHLKRATAAA